MNLKAKSNPISDWDEYGEEDNPEFNKLVNGNSQRDKNISFLKSVGFIQDKKSRLQNKYCAMILKLEGISIRANWNGYGNNWNISCEGIQAKTLETSVPFILSFIEKASREAGRNDIRSGILQLLRGKME